LVSDKKLEQKIEKLREEMYQAYNVGESKSNVLRISEELDMLLNKLQELNKSQ